MKTDKLSNYIPWNIPIPETTILMSYSGVLHKVYRAYGIDISALSFHEKDAISSQINNAFSKIEKGWSLLESEFAEFKKFSELRKY